MVEQRPIVHLICTAHLDPVWMWTWEEGLREAISTFHTAADLLEEFPEFVFNHNESLLYEWVEEYDPPLFERIKRLVQSGRWNISGGWYLQPDCNLSGGETLVRLILEGRRYFERTFGIRPPVAYNFDTFGHPASLPQLLQQSGFQLYIHCRPVASQIDLPAPLYRWRGVDGSEVVALRPDTGWYCTPRDGLAQEQARKGIEQARATGQDVFVFWGLGDHGGGPTRRDLERFRTMIAETTDVEIRHSTPEAFLQRMLPTLDQLPVFEGELQRTLIGTYTSVAPIKQDLRASEALLAAAERWAAINWWRYGAAYPADQLRAAWKRLMLNTFHDTLCGSLIEEAVPGVMDMFGYAQHVARQLGLKGELAALPNQPPTPGTIPIYVLNPHANPMRAYVGLNFMSEYAPPAERKLFTLKDEAGQPLPCDTIGGPAVLQAGTWQPYVGFVADVPPLSARRYEIHFTDQPTVSTRTAPLHSQEDERGIVIENQWWSVRFSRDTAAIEELIEKSTGRNLLQAPLRLFAMHDVSHAWGGENRAIYNEPFAPFAPLTPAEVGDYSGVEGQSGPALRIIASGSVSITVEALVGWQHTRASLKTTFYADLPQIDIDLRLYMQARRKMIKLQLPFDLPGTRAICEVPYGTAERPADATEWPYHRWLRLETPEMTVGIANNGQAGFDVSPDGVLNLSLTRGATHSSWEGDPGGPAIDTRQSYTYMDQGQLDLRFRLLAGPSAPDVAAALIPAALELHQPLARFFTYYPPSLPTNAPAQPIPFLAIEPSSVVLGALKKAEAEDALIIRLVETTGQPTAARIRFDGGPAQTISFGPHQIQTFKVTRDNQWQACNLLEE